MLIALIWGGLSILFFTFPFLYIMPIFLIIEKWSVKSLKQGFGFALVIGYVSLVLAKVIEELIVIYVSKSRSELSPENIKQLVPWITFVFGIVLTYLIKNIQYNWTQSELINNKMSILILSFITSALFSLILSADKSRNLSFRINGNNTVASFESIHSAAKESNLVLLKEELAKSVNPNLKNSLGSTPLHLAVEFGFQAGVEELISSGASVNAKGALLWNGTALMVAANNGQFKISEVLLNAKADPNIKDDRGDTAVFFAARSGELEILKLLIDHGAVINLIGGSGFSLLSEASGSEINFEPNPKSGAIVKYLIEEKNMPVNEHDTSRRSPLFSASQALNFEATEVLVKHGAKIIQNSEYEKSLILNVINRRNYGSDKELCLNIIKLLLKTDININTKGNIRIDDIEVERAPIEYAKELNDLEVVKLLESKIK